MRLEERFSKLKGLGCVDRGSSLDLQIDSMYVHSRMYGGSEINACGSLHAWHLLLDSCQAAYLVWSDCIVTEHL